MALQRPETSSMGLSGSLTWPTPRRSSSGSRKRAPMPRSLRHRRTHSHAPAFRRGSQCSSLRCSSKARLSVSSLCAAAGKNMSAAPGVSSSARRQIRCPRSSTRSWPQLRSITDYIMGRVLVTSLARPGGNLTGLAQLEFSLVGKLVEALKEIAPAVTQVALISNPDNPATELYRRSFETAAVSLNMEPVKFAVHQPADIKLAIENVAHKPNAGVVFPPT